MIPPASSLYSSSLGGGPGFWDLKKKIDIIPTFMENFKICQNRTSQSVLVYHIFFLNDASHLMPYILLGFARSFLEADYLPCVNSKLYRCVFIDWWTFHYFGNFNFKNKKLKWTNWSPNSNCQSPHIFMVHLGLCIHGFRNKIQIYTELKT